MTTHTPPYHGNDEPKPLLATALSYPQPDTIVCTAVGEIDLGSAALLREQLQTAVAQQPRCVVADLSAVTFFAAAGVGVLDEARDALAERAAPGSGRHAAGGSACARHLWRGLPAVRRPRPCSRGLQRRHPRVSPSGPRPRSVSDAEERDGVELLR